MGLSHDFSLAPVHAHLNLVGWASLALFGLAYRGWPELARSPLAPLHLVLSGGGAVLLPAGIWFARAGGGIAPALVGAVMAMAGALVFAVALLRLAAGGAARRQRPDAVPDLRHAPPRAPGSAS
jgi:hypothetical protein